MRMEGLDFLAPELLLVWFFAVPPIFGREEQLWYGHWSTLWRVPLSAQLNSDLYL